MPATNPELDHTALDLVVGEMETTQVDPGEWNPGTCVHVYCV